MIKHIRITSFKSLEDVEVSLEGVTVLIGRSGSGKSNFVDSLRWLRDYLTSRDENPVHQRFGGWDQVMSATARRPLVFSFEVTFAAPGMSEDFHYTLKFQQNQPQQNPTFQEERLSLGGRVLFHQGGGNWIQPPSLPNPPRPGPVMLGALTGLREGTIAYSVLTKGIGCYAFPDSVLTTHGQGATEFGLADNGENFLGVFNAIQDSPPWHHIGSMTASLRAVRSSLRSIELVMPSRKKVLIVHQADGHPLTFSLSQESEGFRRLLACLIALYQEPPKQTLIFDEPEKGLSPAGLAVLADEFKGYASKERGQVILTTHSPEFLDHFAPEQIRVVEMHGYATQIGSVAPEQMEALREHSLEKKELLTADEARLEGSLKDAE
jgi:predicted ATPase